MFNPAPARAGLAKRRALAVSLELVAREVGVDVVGFGELGPALPDDFEHLPVGISLGVAHPAMVELLAADAEGLSPDRQQELERQLCDHRDRDGQQKLEVALRMLADVLGRQGYRYFCVPPDVDPMDYPFTALMVRRFSHKAAATCAGLGWVGRHGLLNHPVYGPHVSWATLLTNAPLDAAAPTVVSECGECRRCVSVCPAGAITGRDWSREDGMVSLVDVERCRRTLVCNEQTTGIWVCGQCALACGHEHLVRRTGEATPRSDGVPRR